VVLGGTLLKGGRVSVAGILGAVLFLGVLSNILNLLQVPAFTQIVVKGLIVIAAILVDRPREAAAA
jgi:ribose/xylose/arabinose/galactoside ABC-type transport system permease subunit